MWWVTFILSKKKKSNCSFFSKQQQQKKQNWRKKSHGIQEIVYPMQTCCEKKFFRVESMWRKMYEENWSELEHEYRGFEPQCLQEQMD